ncbi:MAG: MFS transporter [Bacillota bacterium]
MGAAASWLLWKYFHEEIQVREHRVDYPGAVLLTVGVLTLLLGLLQGGVSHPWTSPYILSLLVVAAFCLAVFLRVESRAAEPTLPLSLFRNPIISVSNLAGFLAGAVMIGMTTYLPLFAQGVQGATATTAGAILAPLSIGWPIGSTVGGRVILRLGYRVSAVLGMAFDVVGASVLLLVDRAGGLPLWVLMSLMFITGLGLGFSTLAFVLAIQNAVGWRQRGVATASAQFLRNLGSTLGVSLMGTVLNLRLIARLRALPEAVPTGASGAEVLSRVNNLLEPETWPTLPAELLAGFRQALAQSLRGVHWMILGAALAGLVVAWFIPSGRAEDFAAPEDDPAPPPGQPETTA